MIQLRLDQFRARPSRSHTRQRIVAWNYARRRQRVDEVVPITGEDCAAGCALITVLPSPLSWLICGPRRHEIALITAGLGMNQYRVYKASTIVAPNPNFTLGFPPAFGLVRRSIGRLHLIAKDREQYAVQFGLDYEGQFPKSVHAYDQATNARIFLPPLRVDLPEILCRPVKCSHNA